MAGQFTLRVRYDDSTAGRWCNEEDRAMNLTMTVFISSLSL